MDSDEVRRLKVLAENGVVENDLLYLYYWPQKKGIRNDTTKDYGFLNLSSQNYCLILMIDL
jgi:hypothetical protein